MKGDIYIKYALMDNENDEMHLSLPNKKVFKSFYYFTDNISTIVA